MASDARLRATRWLTTETRELPPSAFSFVMATGIVSTALRLVDEQALSTALLALTIAGAVVLAVMSVGRIAMVPHRVVSDAADPERAFGFFTVVAGINVLVVRLDLAGHHAVALALAALSVPFWLVQTYAIPGGLMLGTRTVPVVNGVNGSWFLWVVATQSLAVAGATIGREQPSLTDSMTPAAVGLWGVGVVLYLTLVVLVTLRLLSVTANPHTFSPTYWIYMGATAITVVAGARISELPSTRPVMRATEDVVTGLTYILWSFGTWWIPLLLGFGVWRHGLKREPVRYESGLWSMVFPLGMYAVGSILYGRSEGIDFMVHIGRVEVWIAFAAWVLVTAGMTGAVLTDACRAGRAG